MKLVPFKNNKGQTKIGWLKDNGVVEMQKADQRLPNDMLSFIDGHEDYYKIIKNNNLEAIPPHYTLEEVTLLAPLPNPRSFRDYIGFEQHMA
ncbi:hypothetical protein ACM55I_11670 [Flavobacterium sp. GB2R13]|uniref:hypothetical protein n=1 Tax=Flavobacterium algoris TaxID=3398733 RepID=UPI003A8812F7